MQVRYNLTKLEEWARDNDMDEIHTVLVQAIQISQLLQVSLFASNAGTLSVCEKWSTCVWQQSPVICLFAKLSLWFITPGVGWQHANHSRISIQTVYNLRFVALLLTTLRSIKIHSPMSTSSTRRTFERHTHAASKRHAASSVLLDVVQTQWYTLSVPIRICPRHVFYSSFLGSLFAEHRRLLAAKRTRALVCRCMSCFASGTCRCGSLNALQMQKILTMYTPAENEERVPANVIRAVCIIIITHTHTRHRLGFLSGRRSVAYG